MYFSRKTKLALPKRIYRSKTKLFFCEFIPKNEDLRDCPSCPAKQVDKRFHCEGLHVEVEYDWDLHPKAFRRKINRLHKKFLSQR